ncbi:MAG: hypothetical protein RH859_09620 [Longimicrobiales bacterium]
MEQHPPPGARLGAAFCSARFRDVPVLLEAGSGPPPHDRDSLLSCLDYGVRCTGWLCPLFTVPTLPPEDLMAEAMEAERQRVEGARRPPHSTPGG